MALCSIVQRDASPRRSDDNPDLRCHNLLTLLGRVGVGPVLQAMLLSNVWVG
jgi:hypothetical protein